MTLEEAIHHAEEKAKCGGKCGEDHAQLAEWLKELRERRAAEPEKRTEEHTETHACDCIDRQAAIEAMDGFNACGYVEEPFERLEKALKEIPAAEPERKTGRWIDRSGGMASSWNYCSVCGEQQIYRYDFCPNCGADMRGGQDGSD